MTIMRITAAHAGKVSANFQKLIKFNELKAQNSKLTSVLQTVNANSIVNGI